MDSNEVMFYIGLAVTICSVLSGIIYFCISKIRAIRLQSKLDSEYGEDKK